MDEWPAEHVLDQLHLRPRREGDGRRPYDTGRGDGWVVTRPGSPGGRGDPTASWDVPTRRLPA
jgi:hypothetical protein